MRNVMGYNLFMIKTFNHKGLEKFFGTGSTAGVQVVHAKRLRLILAMLDKATVVSDMDAPGMRLHSLKGDRKGDWAVTVQANWRITFRFEGGNAHIVDYLDYH